MSKFGEICAHAYTASSRSEKMFSFKYHLFSTEVSRKAFKMFWKYSVSSNDETSLSFIYCFWDVITQPIDCFADIPGLVEGMAEKHLNNIPLISSIPQVVC